MKIKAPHREIISFVLTNLFLLLSCYIAAFIFIVAIFAASLAIKCSAYGTGGLCFKMLIGSIILFIFLLLFIIAKYFLIYILFKKIENKGSQKFKNILQNLRNSFSLKLKVLLSAFILDILFVTFLSFTSPEGLNKITFTDRLFEYTISGPLFLIYAFTFILFRIENVIKMIKTKKNQIDDKLLNC